VTKPIDNISDPRYVRALSHPLRVRILAILEERTASPLELARILRADLGVVAYHVRTLRSLGLLTLVRETKVRGATQRHYKAIERPRISDDAWAQAPPIAKQALVDATLQQVADYARGSAAAGGFDRPDAHLTRTALRLDREGWERLARALNVVLAEVAEIEEDVRRRRSAGGEEHELEHVGLVMMLFEALPFSALPADDLKAAPADCTPPDGQG
jgi:DNA-binding transcriptional ArsR family regulator